MNINNPDYLLEELKKVRAEELKDLEDDVGNNLLHSGMNELMQQKDTKSFKELLDNSKPWIKYLVMQGVKLNAENDRYQTPSAIAWQQLNDDKFVYDFLIQELGGHVMYASGKPEWRKFKKILYRLMCCKRKNS